MLLGKKKRKEISTHSDQNRIECLAMEFCFYMNTRINKIPKLKKNESKSQGWY